MPKPRSRSQPLTFLAGGGEMGERMRRKDWSKSALGPAKDWPQSLKTAVRIMLTSRQAIWIGWGPELVYLYNDPYQAIIGGKHPTALGQPTKIVWREIWDVIGPMLSTAMAGDEGTYVESQLLIMERNGYREETYYTFSYSPIPDDDGSAGGIICANTDDTRRVIGERQLALLRELAAGTANAHTRQDAWAGARQALASNPLDLPFALIFVPEPEGPGLMLAETCGIDRSHPIAANAGAWPLDRARTGREILIVDALKQAFGNDLPTGAWAEAPARAALIPLAAQGETSRGGVLVVGLNALRLFDENYKNFLVLVGGQIAASIASAQTHEAERRRAEALAELDRAKTEFFSNISHEFRTPLTLMLGPIEDLLEKRSADLTPATKSQLETVHRNSLRLMKLVNTMLDFSRIEAGRAEADFASVDLAAYTAELASVFRAALERAGLKLIVACAPLPEPVSIDREMWEKIVLNLLSNAFKFTLTGEIEVKLEAIDGHARLTVRDTGVGIPPEEVPKVFERFHRVRESRGRTHEGTGIGLALVQELVQLHSGTIRLESKLDEGSRFIVSVPLGKAHLDPRQIRALPERAPVPLAAQAFVKEAMRWVPGGDPPPDQLWAQAGGTALEPGRAAGEAAGPAIERPRILWADDNADMRDYVKRLLAERFAVTAVGDGEAALAAMRAERPELVLSDIMMPKLDGFGLLRAVRTDPALNTIPVILLSARAGEEARVEGVEAGADDYLIKPFSARELLARVESHLKMARFRRESESALRESEGRHRLLVSVITDVPWTADASGAFVTPQPAWQAYTGQTWEEHRGLGWLNAVHPDDREPIGSGWQTATANRIRYVGRARLWHAATREWRHYEAQAAPLLDADGRVREWTGSCTDNEDRIRAEQRLKVARDDALAANRAKDEFLATLSHELRTPLNPVLLVASDSAEDQTLPARVRADFKMIADNISLQARLIDDLLDFNRIIHGKVTLERRPLDLHEVVREATATIHEEIGAKKINLTFSLHAPDHMVSGDPVRLRQVFWNILKNAVKFTPVGGHIEISSPNIAPAAEIEVRVRDSGIGMAPTELARNFHPFVQGRHADENHHMTFGGLGLGLAISRMLAESHHGSICAESPGPDQGSTIIVRLPLRGPAAGDGNRPGDAHANGSRTAFMGEEPRHRVLLVEDHEPTRTTLSRLLQRRGYDVTVTQSVADALQRADQAAFDVLISDLGLPDGDGCELMRKLRTKQSSLPGIALSGFGMDSDLSRSRAAGFEEHLTKPVSIDSLDRALTRLLERSKTAALSSIQVAGHGSP